MATSGLRRGVYLPPFGPFGDPGVLVDLAVRAEAAGWDGVFLWDHVVGPTPPIADTWTALAAMAGATQRIHLGPTVTPLPRRRPWVVARQASTVSRLSGGRLVLGVGLGSDESGDFSRFGEQREPVVRAAMLDEAMDVVRAMWAGGPLDRTGPHYEVHLDASTPEPHRIPVWVASSVRHPLVLRRAARHDGIFPIADRPLAPEQVAAVATSVRRAGVADAARADAPDAAAGADRRFDVVVSGDASAAWDRPNPDGVDLTAIAEAGATWWLESLIHLDPLDLSLQVVDAGPP